MNLARAGSYELDQKSHQILDVGGMREKPIKLCHRGIGGVIGIRVSNHFFNTMADINYLVEMQKKILDK